MYINKELTDSIQVLPIPTDRTYMHSLLHKLMERHRLRLEAEKTTPQFFLEGVASKMNTFGSTTRSGKSKKRRL
jgi:hypothetical protein